MWFLWPTRGNGWAFLPRLRDEVLLDEALVQRHAEAGAVGHLDVPVHRLDLLDGQFVPQRRVLDAVLEHERIPAGAQPVDARGHGDRARVAVVAQPGPDLFNPAADVRGVGE